MQRLQNPEYSSTGSIGSIGISSTSGSLKRLQPLHRRSILVAVVATAALFSVLLLNWLGSLADSSQKAKATADLLTALRDVHSKRMTGMTSRTGAGSNYTCAPLVADALRRGANPNARYGVTPGSPEAAYLWAARQLGGQWIGQRIANWVPQDTTLEAREHRPALMMAMSQDDVEAMRLLLKAGANRVYTPISSNSSSNGPNPGPSGCRDIVSLATGSRSLEMVQFALSLGGDPNCVDGWDMVPLESTMGSPAVTRLLLEHGANPSIQKQGMPLLAWLHTLRAKLKASHHHNWPPEREAAFAQSLALIEAASKQATPSTVQSNSPE